MKKSRFLLILVCAVMVVGLLCGCAKEEIKPALHTDKVKIVREIEEEKEIIKPEVIMLPFDKTLDFGFSSGAGAWYTSLTLKPDGTFVGSYHDSEMGSVGEGYPLGTVYMSEFSGKFTDIKKLNDYSYSLKLSELVIEDEGKEYIEDEIRYVVLQPGGMDGEEFILYLPDVPVSELSDEFLSWKQGGADDSEKLSVYGLYNKSSGAGFFTGV